MTSGERCPLSAGQRAFNSTDRGCAHSTQQTGGQPHTNEGIDMQGIRRIFVGGAILVLTVVVTSAAASANRLSVTRQTFAAQWSSLSIDGAGSDIECTVFIGATFHSRTISKVRGSLIGHIIDAPQPTSCLGGSATMLQETLPWHVSYEGFTGTLPTISGIVFLLVGVRIRVDPNGIQPPCLAETTTMNNLSATAIRDADGDIGGLRADETDRIPLLGDFGCNTFTAAFSGTAAVGAGRFTLI